MDIKVIIDWKSLLALGLGVVGIIFAVKMDPETAKEVSIRGIDAAKEYATACIGVR